MSREIEIVDRIMGSGKTRGIIQWMLARPNNKYIYISPLLEEVEKRIPNKCQRLHFVSPNTEDHRTKAEHLLELLSEGYNVSFTHSLFENLNRKHLEYIRQHGYTLIIDEEIDFVEPYQGSDYKSADILTLEKSGHVVVNEDNLGRVDWNWDDETFHGGNYEKLKNMCDLEMLHCAKRDRSMMVTHLPISLITSCQRVIVMTYLFENSVMSRFMEMKGVTVKTFTELENLYTEAEIKKRACEKIEFIKTNSIRKVRHFGLSSTWYTKNSTKEQLKKVENAILSVCRLAEHKEDVMFTFPKDLLKNPNKKNQTKYLNIRGFMDESKETYWVFCGTKATNSYAHKTLLIHAFNRYPMLSVSSYLADYGFPLEDDEYALSEMIQWVWRSAIREPHGKIKLAILSPRMESIFKRWLDSC